MTKYIDAKLQIVRMDNNDIITESVNIGDPITGQVVIGNAPGRRSIWD